MKLRLFRWDIILDYLGWAQGHHKGPSQRQAEGQNQSRMSWRKHGLEGRDQEPRNARQPVEAGRSSPLAFPEGTTHADTLILTFKTHFGLRTSRTTRE